MRKAQPVLMEPIMKVAVIVPEEYMGDVIGDLNSRRGMIQGMDALPGASASTPWFLCLRCSVTLPTCALRLRERA